MKADGSQRGASEQSGELRRTGAAAVRAALESRSPQRSRAPLIVGIALGLVVLGVIAAGLFQALRPKGGLGAAAGSSPATAPASVRPARAGAGAAARSPISSSSSEIILGLAGPFTGLNKELGRGMKAGIDLAFAVANQAGGVGGRTLTLVALDDGFEPSRTDQVMKELIEERKALAIVGNVGGATAAVSAPYLSSKKVVLFGALSGSPVLRRDPPDRYVFNFRPGYGEETAAAARYLMESRKIKPEEIVVFAQQDQFGDAGHAGVIRQMRDSWRFHAAMPRVGYKRNTADVTQAVARVRELQPKAIIMVATYHAAAVFIEKVREAGLKPIFTNVSEVDGVALAEELLQRGGATLTENVIVTQVVPPPTSNASVVMRYREALATLAVGERPGFISLEGYIVGTILVEGLKRAGSPPTSEKLVEALESIQDLDLGIGAPITFSPKEHQASHKIWAMALTPTGAYQPVDLE